LKVSGRRIWWVAAERVYPLVSGCCSSILFLCILDTVGARILLAMGSAYLNLHQLGYLISSDNYYRGQSGI